MKEIAAANDMKKQISALNKLNVLWGLVVLSYSLIHIFIIPEPWGYWSISDTGLFSILTISLATTGLLLLIVIITKIKQPSIKTALILLSYVILIYILREADLHRLLTDEHVTKMKFYTNSSINLSQRILGGSVMGLFIATSLFLFFRYGLLFLQHLFNTQPWAVSIALWASILLISQLIDKSGLNDIYLGRVVEEMLEFCAAGYSFLAVYASYGLLIKSSATCRVGNNNSLTSL